MATEGEQARLLAIEPVQVEVQGLDLPLGEVAYAPSRFLDLPVESAAPPGAAWWDLRRLLAELPATQARVAARALHLAQWIRRHRFCGRCGGANAELAGEVARRCPSCSHIEFPRISPAVVVLVTRGAKAVLGRGADLPARRFSTIAGFVEPGESLEEAVRREIREEVGIELTTLRYVGSQPWPCPDSLMVAFRAESAETELRTARSEIAEAAWFRWDELPPVPPSSSIARQLIDSWVREQGGDPGSLVTWTGLERSAG